MKFTIAIAAVLFAGAAYAADDDAFTGAVLKCWNNNISVGKSDKFVMSVEINKDGSPIDLTAKEYSNKATIDIFKRALARCAPYDFPAGVYTITLDKNTFGGKSLDPFK